LRLSDLLTFLFSVLPNTLESDDSILESDDSIIDIKLLGFRKKAIRAKELEMIFQTM